MKNFLKTIAVAFLMSLPFPTAGMAAAVSGYPVGYCYGEMNSTARIKYSDKNAVISAAIFVPAQYAATIQGNRVESIRVALCSTRNVDNLNVWIRQDLNGDDIARGDAPEGTYRQGWNDIALSEPLRLTQEVAQDGFYIGYSYTQKSKSGAISALATPHENALWIQCGENGEWEDRSEEGTLALEAMVFGDNLPKLNVQLVNVIPDRWYIMSDGNLNAVALVRNAGVETVTSFDIKAEMGSITATAHVDCDIPYGETRSCKVVMRPDISSANPETVDAAFTITAINGKDDEDYSDNTVVSSFKVVEKAYPRNVFVEEFTTEACPNCPRVGEYLHDMLGEPLYAGRVEVVCHHSGYHTDSFTQPCDEEYLWFYGDEGSYAPAVMADRTPFTSTTSPVNSIPDNETLTAIVDNRLAEPSMLSVDVACTVEKGDDGRNVAHVTVSGQRCKDNLLDADGRICVYLTEDNVEAESQSGAGVGYLHQHVIRGVNSTWGEPLVWDGNDYGYTCDFALNDVYKMSDLKVVAFVGRYNSNDRTDCAIENSGSCTIATTGLEENVSVDRRNRQIRGIYNVSGAKLNRLSHGLNIVVYSDNTVSKVIEE